ncbi:putative Ktr system potassium uptake protein A [Clostridiales bacterium KA00134]|nr:putative Ktr system potassium uptake protein A [Clostridiales bacterium KA00134]
MKNYVVFGSGRFGSEVAMTLMDLGNEVLVIDKDYDKVQAISEYVTTALQADTMDENVEKDLGLSNFDGAIIAIGESLEASIMAVLVCKDAGIKEIIAKSTSVRNGEILRKLGADRIIYPEKDMGKRLAYNLSNSNFYDYISLSKEFTIAELKIPDDWANKTISQIDIRRSFGFSVLAIKKQKDAIIQPQPTEMLEKGDYIIVLGKKSSLAKFKDR